MGGTLLRDPRGTRDDGGALLRDPLQGAPKTTGVGQGGP